MAVTKARTSLQILFDSNIDLQNNYRVTGALDPTAAQDVATKNYVDSIAQGLDIKQSVRAASTANINLSAPGASHDGVTFNNGDRVLCKDQTTAAQKGIYIWNGASVPMTRAADFDSWEKIISAFVFVEEGTLNADTGWVCTNNAGGTLGTTAITFTQFSGAGTYQAGNGLTLTGNAFSANLDASGALEFNSGAMRVKLDGSTLTRGSNGLKVTDNTYAPIAHVGSGGSSHPAATTSVNGFMSSGDKTKLDGIATGAQVNQNAWTHINANGTTLSATTATDTFILTPSGAISISGSSKTVTIGIGVDNSTIEVSSSKLRVKASGITASHLATDAVQTTKIQNNAVTAAKIAAAAVGNGLTGGGGSAITVGAGDGIIVNTSSVQVDPSCVLVFSRYVKEVFTNHGGEPPYSFTLTYTPSKTQLMFVFLNGYLMNEGTGNDYTISGTAITFLFALKSSDVVVVHYYKG
jgi:hypothetical protein